MLRLLNRYLQAASHHRPTRFGRLARGCGALTVLSLLVATTSAASTTTLDERPPSVRFIDLTGDGLTDKLIDHGDSLSVSINLSGGVFAELPTQLPATELKDVLVTDLDGDGLIDLYLVSQGENVALLGDGSGTFFDATERLGLADGGHGVSAERMVFDIHGEDALVLHNTHGDVLFWPTANGFVRDVGTPILPSSSAHPDTDLAALEQLVAGAAELLALDPNEELVLSIDHNGQPQISLGRQSLHANDVNTLSNERFTSSSATASPGASGTTAGPTGFGSHNPPAIAALTSDEQDILDTMSIVMLDDGAGNLVNKTVRFTGVNVQVVNGLGATNGNTNNPASINPANTVVNGVGNLIVGYNELGNTLADARTGSHNVVLGQTNSHTTFGGLLGGRNNTISGVFASVSGGEKNNAKARLGSISGGKSNTVKGAFTSISGGTFNVAVGQNASVSGGQANKASGGSSWVGGGRANEASGLTSTVSAGWSNTASGKYSSIAGGSFNTASGQTTSVTGGIYNQATGFRATVSGGNSNQASGTSSTVSGGRQNTASASYTSVSGGNTRSAANTDDWVAGTLLEDN